MRTFEEVATLERSATVKTRVSQILENAILWGMIGKDEVLNEVALAEKFKVSRTPVREALQELGSMGLLESAGRRGKRVRRIQKKEVRELFWLRQVLEGAIAERLALNGLTNEQSAEIDRHLERQKDAMSADDLSVFLSADISFHIDLAGFLDYPKVKAIVINLRQLLQILGLKAIRQKGRLQDVLSEHTKLVEAIKHGDAIAARRAANEHLARTEQLVIAELERERDI